MNNRHASVTPRSVRAGFTLVELLVVIGIIALLVSILMPSLAAARRQAQTIACGANLRSILQAMHMYASENKSFFPGPMSSGRFLHRPDLTKHAGYNDINCPMVVQNWDWQSPLARYMNIKFDEGATKANRTARFEVLRTHPALSCPTLLQSEMTTTSYTLIVSAGPTVSYALATQFHLLPAGTTNGILGISVGSDDLTTQPGYVPKLTKIGDAAKKVYLADGCRYSGGGDLPSVNMEYFASGGGAYGDMGPFWKDSHCWDRSHAPGNAQNGSVDARVYAFRHGGKPNGAADSFRFNVGFFDGHVENMGDLQGSDPSLWMPKGTYYNPGGGGVEMSKDAQDLYGTQARTIQ